MQKLFRVVIRLVERALLVASRVTVRSIRCCIRQSACLSLLLAVAVEIIINRLTRGRNRPVNVFKILGPMGIRC